MTGYVLASLIFLGGIGTAVIGELVSDEIRGWLDHLPRLILRLAARRLNPVGKITIYDEEWLPELTSILRGAEARPISRLVLGVRFSVGLLISARRVARHLHRTLPGPARPGLAMPGTAPADLLASARNQLQLLTLREDLGWSRHATIAAQITEMRKVLACVERFEAEAAQDASESMAATAAEQTQDARAALAALYRDWADSEAQLSILIGMRACQEQLLGGG